MGKEKIKAGILSDGSTFRYNKTTGTLETNGEEIGSITEQEFQQWLGLQSSVTAAQVELANSAFSFLSNQKSNLEYFLPVAIFIGKAALL